MSRLLVPLILILTPLVLSGQVPSDAPADPFRPVSFLIGRWQGTTEGQPGKGTVVREYSRALNSKFIRVHERADREHSSRLSRPGDVRRDWA
jgi:hypothetical protein